MKEVKEIIVELMNPTPKKVLMVFIVSVFLLSAEYSDSIWHYQGFPLPLFKWGGPGNVSRDHAYSTLYFVFIDIVFWYPMGCLLAWLITLSYCRVWGR